LETLDLCFMTFNSFEESNTSARKFYKSVLPQLVHSLQVLKIQPWHEGRWCFDPEDVFQSVSFSQCIKLRSLSVALNSTSIVPFSNYYLRVYKDNLYDAISSLINLSLSLPTLSEIYIVIPKLAFESDEVAMRLIARSITEISIHDGHKTPHIGQKLPDIWVNRKELYQYQAMNDEERQKYVLTYYCDQNPLDPYPY